jgi:hypothetical protein
MSFRSDVYIYVKKRHEKRILKELGKNFEIEKIEEDFGITTLEMLYVKWYESYPAVKEAIELVKRFKGAIVVYHEDGEVSKYNVEEFEYINDFYVS